jgi:hypothetical protein
VLRQAENKTPFPSLRGLQAKRDEAIQITKIKYLYDKTYQNIGKGGIVYRLGCF